MGLGTHGESASQTALQFGVGPNIVAELEGKVKAGRTFIVEFFQHLGECRWVLCTIRVLAITEHSMGPRGFASQQSSASRCTRGSRGIGIRKESRLLTEFVEIRSNVWAKDI